MEDTPQRIGRYRIERRLGSGSMGHVYLAYDDDLDRAVAIKTLRDLALDDETRALFNRRFQNEARAAGKLHHPNIVQVFDVGDDPEQGPYLVFEYVPGHTLKEQLRKRGPLPKDELLAVAQQVADALATAHAAGIIHRDLKPENLLVTENGLVKLADFGIARVPNADLTKEGQFLGTPCYSAPETLLKGVYNEQTDLFSLGAVLYEAASGERAFPGSEAMLVAQNVMHRDPVPPSEVNRGANIPMQVDRLIMRALSKEPADRFDSARTLVASLRDAYEGKRPERVRTRRRRAIPLTLLVLAAAGAGTWAWISNRSDAETDPSASGGSGGGGALVAADAGVIGDGGEDTDGGSEISALPAEGGMEPDAGLEELSPHEREEAAKDELARARDALSVGDRSAAKAALDRAGELDPSNPDIAALKAEVDAD